MKIYEVIDSTDDDKYYTLGFFRTLDEAKQAITEKGQPHQPISTWVDEEFESIAIKEHTFGWGGFGKRVYEIYREEQYDEKTDKNEWVTIKRREVYDSGRVSEQGTSNAQAGL